MWCFARRLRGALPCWREFAIRPRLLPEPERDWNRVDVELRPPCSFISRAMQFAMVSPADRHDKLIAHSAAQCTRLRKGEVMRVGWRTAAYEAGLPQHEFPVVFIAQANRLAQGTDYVAARLLLGPARGFVAGSAIRPAAGHLQLHQVARQQQEHQVSH